MHPLWIVTTVALVLIAIIAVRFALVLRATVATFEQQSKFSTHALSTERLRQHRGNTLKKVIDLRRSLRSSWGSEQH